MFEVSLRRTVHGQNPSPVALSDPGNWKKTVISDQEIKLESFQPIVATITSGIHAPTQNLPTLRLFFCTTKSLALRRFNCYRGQI